MPLATPTSCSAALAAGGGVQEDYQLFALAGSYRFGDHYTLRLGIENLLDEEPPIVGVNPTQVPFPNPGVHVGLGFGTAVGSTYDPLRRRAFLSMTMDF